MTSCKLVTGNYKGLYLACIMRTYGYPLLYGAFLATNGIPIQAIDVPSLHALDSDSDEDSADDTIAETVVATLTHITKGKAAFLLIKS